MKKEYKMRDRAVVWEPDKCIHSGICARGLSRVFKPAERPWIQTENSDQESIVKQVRQCPSGALSIKEL